MICENPDYARVGAVRAADVSFVLDELTGRSPTWEYGGLIDTDRIAMVGHSAGGFSTIPALLSEARIKAAVNMDGNFRYPNDTLLSRPMLMLGKPSHVPGGPDPTWDKTWTELTARKRWLSVDSMEHLSFTDVAPLAEQLDIPVQDLDGDRCDTVTRAYITAFVDRHLRGRNAPLLDNASAVATRGPDSSSASRCSWSRSRAMSSATAGSGATECQKPSGVVVQCCL